MATATIVSRDGFEVVEGESLDFSLMFNDVSNVSATYRYSFSSSLGSAEPSDFSGSSGSGSTSISSFPASDREVASFSVRANRDGIEEENETLFLNVSLSGIQFVDNTSTKSFSITILDNSPPEGNLALIGRPLQGSELTIDASNISDHDGLGPLNYQWFRDGSTIAGQRGESYTLVESDVFKTISVQATYTDGLGIVETVQSEATSVVENRIELIGTEADETLQGSESPEEIIGQNGDDVLSGEGDTDILSGGEGNDFIYGDSFELRYALSEANQVFRLYQATFNRTPDEMGHKRWTSDLLTGEATLADVREGFVGSQEFRSKYASVDNATFVKQMYINVLDRDFDQGEVTQAEINNWTNRITDSFTRADVVNGFAESQQLINNTLQDANALALNSNPASWSDDVYRLYQATLDRAPDLAGFEGWSEALADGRSLTQVISGFTNSREFANTYGTLTDPEDFVKLLYNNVLDRDFGAGEVAQSEISGWTSRLSDTFTRANIVQGFSQSLEFKNKTAQELKDWVRAQGVDDQINGGAGTNVLAGGALSDQFVFSQADSATNTVVDLEAWDYMSFDGFGYNSAAEARGHMVQSGGSVVFSDQGTEVTFERFQLSDFTDDMILI